MTGPSPATAGADAERVPPGQYVTTDFPVLHEGPVQQLDRQSWRLELTGLIDPHRVVTWDDLVALPAVEQTSDLHCVTRWTKLGTHWKGVRARQVLKGVAFRPEARHVLIRAAGGWTTNLPLEELVRDDVLLAYEHDGQLLTAEHGGPVRLLVPRLYLWKSAKWITGIEFTADQHLGYWESLGYHPIGNPWLEQRYA